MANATKTSGKKLMTPEFRVSFPNVFVPRAPMDGAEPKYSLTMLFPKSTDLKALKALAQEAAVEKWGANIPKNIRSPFRDGDKDKEHLEGYKGCIFVAATSKMKPGLVDQSVQAIIQPEDFYAGCYARATVNAYAYDKNGNKGVAFGLQNIQKLRDGQPFSGRTAPTDDFDAVSGGEEGAGEAPAGGESMFD